MAVALVLLVGTWQRVDRTAGTSVNGLTPHADSPWKVKAAIDNPEAGGDAIQGPLNMPRPPEDERNSNDREQRIQAATEQLQQRFRESGQEMKKLEEELARGDATQAAQASESAVRSVEEAPARWFQPDQTVKRPKRNRVFIFTMDSLQEREEERLRGGAGGEAFVRKACQRVLTRLGFTVDVIASDRDMLAADSDPVKNGDKYAYFIFDEWTVISPNHRPRAIIQNREKDVFIMSFFGQPRNPLQGLSLAQYLTPYPMAGNTYLGYPLFFPVQRVLAKKRQGIVWGKQLRYLQDHAELLKRIAARIPLHATVADADANHEFFQSTGVTNHGHMTHEEYTRFLSESLFFLGLGDPVLGPSAMEALVHGMIYIDPVYAHAKSISGTDTASQHPYAAKEIGSPLVCAARLEWSEVQRCFDVAEQRYDIAKAQVALAATGEAKQNTVSNLHGYIHPDMQLQPYVERCKHIFGVPE